MPIFDFICKACGREFETLVLGGSRAVCPDCGSEDLTKKMSTFAFRRGGGSGGSSGSSGSGSGCTTCSSSNCSTCH